MKKDIQDIIPGAGLGGIKFGMSRTDIVDLIGAPDDKEKYAYDEEDDVETEIWHYDELELSLGFDEDEDWRLTSIAVTGAFYELDSVSLIGKEIEVVKAELQNIGIDDLELEDWSSLESPDHKLLTSEDAGMNFWFDEMILSEIQWGPLFVDDETISWEDISN